MFRMCRFLLLLLLPLVCVGDRLLPAEHRSGGGIELGPDPSLRAGLATSAGVRSSEVRSPEVRSPEVRSPGVGSPQGAAADIESALEAQLGEAALAPGGWVAAPRYRYPVYRARPLVYTAPAGPAPWYWPAVTSEVRQYRLRYPVPSPPLLVTRLYDVTISSAGQPQQPE